MSIPVSMLSYVYRVVCENQAAKDKWLEKFNLSGFGGFWTYDKACNQAWSLGGVFTQEEAKQVVFHSIFGTYKEDLSLLSQITDCGTWYKRNRFGKGLFKGVNMHKASRLQLIKLRFASKLASANQTGFLTENNQQVSCCPVFSGFTETEMIPEFFEYMEKRGTGSGFKTGKTLSQILTILVETADGLMRKIRENNSRVQMGTTQWYEVSKIRLEEDEEKRS